MEILFNLNKQKKLTNFEKNRERSFILIAENINENARTLSIKTGLCVSSIKRYKKIIRSREKIQISHKNKFTKKASHISDSLIENIYKDYISKCKEILNIQLTNNQLSIKEFYYSYLSDELKSLMTYKTLIQRFNQLGLYTIHTTRRGKKIARESRKKISDEITLILKNFKNEVAKNEKKRIALNLKKNLSYGEIVEIDAQFEPYLKDEKPVYLYHAIDAATGCLLAVWFEEQETTLGYQRLLEMVFKKHGFPKMIYSDKRRTFWGNENNQTAFEKILNEKGIEIKCSSNPTHKPHVERSFRTALDKYPVYIDKNNLKNLNDLRLNSDGFRDYYNTRNNKLISKHNVFNQEGKKNGNWAIDLVINRKVLNGVVRYNGKNYAAFDLENKRVIFPFNSNVSLVHSSDNEIYFKYNGKKYFAKEPSGKYLSFSEMWALERGLDISIPAVTKLAFLYKKSGSFFKTMQEYMIKFNRLLTSKNVDSINIEKALLKILSSLKKLYISINEDIKIDT